VRVHVIANDMNADVIREQAAKPMRKKSGPKVKRVFADKRAQEGWEVSRAVERISATLPADKEPLEAQRITFDEEHRNKGLNAIFTAGAVIGTGQRGMLIVPDRTLQILDALKIPYTIHAEPHQ
jgi:hypothetical protein